LAKAKIILITVMRFNTIAHYTAGGVNHELTFVFGKRGSLMPPYPSPILNGLIYYIPGHPEIYWIEDGYARHIPDEATYHGVFGGSPNKQAYPTLLADVSAGPPIAVGTQLVRAGNDPKIYLVEGKTKRWIPNETIKTALQLNGTVHSLPLANVNSFANGPAFVEPNRTGSETVPGHGGNKPSYPEPNYPDTGPIKPGHDQN
jgi:hypothetical protein